MNKRKRYYYIKKHSKSLAFGIGVMKVNSCLKWNWFFEIDACWKHGLRFDFRFWKLFINYCSYSNMSKWWIMLGDKGYLI